MKKRNYFFEALKYPKARLGILEVVAAIAAVWIVVKLSDNSMIQVVVSLFSVLVSKNGVEEYGKYYLALRNGVDLDEEE
ncbi:MAG: hypothetical protein IJI56_01905 [Firmicutes bacterium]|jgi:hypothetical protein|nr:hypothetical protein [Bacillota bacterium]